MADLGRVLVLNAGSSSLKWSLHDAIGASLLARDEPLRTETLGEMGALVRRALDATRPIDAVGHRVTHGGARFREPMVLNDGVRRVLDELLPLDELHLRPALVGIDAVTTAQPKLPQVLVFDTAFHASLAPEAAMYPIPPEWSERFGIRRFGFHGLSVDWSTQRAREILGETPERLLVCHLGGGCSVTAVREGRSVDTTMGYSPLEGLMMATRAGSIDPGAILHLICERGLAPEEVRQTLARRSGWLAVSGHSADMREILAAANAKDPRATLAVAMFVQSLRRGIGAMVGVLGGVDAIAFTGGIGQGSAWIRHQAAQAIPGLKLDSAVNDTATTEDIAISTPDSSVRALIVHAKEEQVVFRETVRLLT